MNGGGKTKVFFKNTASTETKGRMTKQDHWNRIAGKQATTTLMDTRRKHSTGQAVSMKQTRVEQDTHDGGQSTLGVKVHHVELPGLDMWLECIGVTHRQTDRHSSRQASGQADRQTGR